MTDILTYWSLCAVALAPAVAAGAIAGRVAVRRERRRCASLMLEAIYSKRPPVTLLEAPTSVVEIVRVEEPKFDTGLTEAWVEQARSVAERIAAETGHVTVDDVWRECPPPDGADGRRLGNVFLGQGWEKIDEVLSVRGRNAARRIGVWAMRVEEAA